MPCEQDWSKRSQLEGGEKRVGFPSQGNMVTSAVLLHETRPGARARPNGEHHRCKVGPG
jgi:hypothetical protein